MACNLGSRGLGRRAINQAVFHRLYVHDDRVDAELTELFDRLLAPNLKESLQK